MQILSKEKGVNGNNKKKKTTVQKKINVAKTEMVKRTSYL